MNDKMKAEFDAAFVKKFGFGRMLASANADAHQMLNSAEWAWEAAAPPQPIYDESKELESCRSSWEKTGVGVVFADYWQGWFACAQSRAKAGEDV